MLIRLVNIEVTSSITLWSGTLYSLFFMKRPFTRRKLRKQIFQHVNHRNCFFINGRTILSQMSVLIIQIIRDKALLEIYF
jgi:hypothetical protein